MNPRAAYHFMQLVEEHAYQTYSTFLQESGEELKQLPAPQVAINYYQEGDLYIFEEFQTSRPTEFRRPKIENLYDVFFAVCDDELEHVKTMIACQQPDAQETFQSPHTANSPAIPQSSAAVVDEHIGEIIQQVSEKESVEI